jgi:hypothetical protein
VAAAGDGVVAVALPLLAAGITRDPLAIAAVVAAQQLAWVGVALLWPRAPGDRRTLVGGADTLRAIVVGLLAVLAVLGRETILGIQVAAFVVGLGEALTDRSESECADVTRVSARGMLGMAVVGLPLGGVLYEIFPATPFVFDVLAFALAGLLALVAVGRPTSVVTTAEPDDAPPASANSAWMHASAALAAGGASGLLAVLVLFSLDQLGLGAPAFGLLLAGIAAATALGAVIAPEVGRAVGLRWGVAIALLVAGGADIGASRLADPAIPWLSALALGVAAAATMAAAVLTRAWLQVSLGRPVTAEALRSFHLAAWIAGPVGAVAAGWLARQRSVPDAVVAAGIVLIAAAFVASCSSSRKSVDEDGRPVVSWSQSTNDSGTRTSEEV